MKFNIIDNTREREIVFFDIDFEDFVIKYELYEIIDIEIGKIDTRKRNLYTCLIFLLKTNTIIIDYSTYPLALDIKESQTELVKKLLLHQKKITNEINTLS